MSPLARAGFVLRGVLVIAVSAALAGSCAPAAAAAGGAGSGSAVAPLPSPLRVIRSFAPPAHPWEPGDRGVDLAAYAGEPVYAATSGVTLYAGELAGRGVVSIRDGPLRTTYEPVEPIVRVGDAVVAGQLIGVVSAEADSCGPAGSCLHWGAIRSDDSDSSDRYVDPLGLLGPVAVRLLPIWTDTGPADPPEFAPPPAAAVPPPVEPLSVRPPWVPEWPGVVHRLAAAIDAELLTATTAATAMANSTRGHRAAVRRSARPASREVGARPWYASDRSGSR